MKDKEFQLLQAEMFVKTSEGKKLEDELLADKALINQMNRLKGGLDFYYREVNTGHYGIGFDLAIDGIYQPDKIEGPKEVIPGVKNVKFIDENMIHSDEEKDYVCQPGKEHVDEVEEYINEFFKNGGPRKEGFSRKNQYRGSTSHAKSRSEIV